MSEWQPIDTVPHDFSDVLLSNGVWVKVGQVGRDGEYEPLIATISEGEFWLDIGKGAEGFEDRYADFILPNRPTHWMPLPSPSKQVDQ